MERRRSRSVMALAFAFAAGLSQAGYGADSSWDDSSWFDSGNNLSKVCESEESFRFGHGYCLGYVAGAADMAILHRSVCVPKGVSTEQVKGVVKNLISNNAENLHGAASLLIVKALNKAWPCN